MGAYNKLIDGETIFKLYDTYGFPVDLTADIARERELEIDMAGFEAAMEAQRARARASSQFAVDYNEISNLDHDTHFVGYEQLYEAAEVVSLIQKGEPVSALKAGEACEVVLSVTPFYAESGGQVGDKGILTFSAGVFEVNDTQKQGATILHRGVVKKGELKVGSLVEAQVDLAARAATAQNHSATHLLHGALRSILGTHVEQKGSLVAPDRLRFDFTHFAALSFEEIQLVEQRVNEEIRRNSVVETHVMEPERAKAMGAMALFGEKYGETVRVLKMGEASIELCGGTHVKRTGDIGLFKIISEGGIASGVRRIEALSGEKALQYIQENERLLSAFGAQLKAGRAELCDKFSQAFEKQRKLEKELEQLKLKMAQSLSQELVAEASELKGIRFLVKQVSGVETKALREMAEDLKNRLGESIVVLALVDNNQVSLVVGISKNLSAKVKAGELVNFVAQQVGGKGGGRPDFAQAGGTDTSKLSEALASVSQWINERL